MHICVLMFWRIILRKTAVPLKTYAVKSLVLVKNISTRAGQENLCTCHCKQSIDQDLTSLLQHNQTLKVNRVFVIFHSERQRAMTCRSIIPFCSHTKGRRWIAKKLSRFQFWILGQICGPSDTSKESAFGIELSFFFVKMFDVECGLVHFSSVMRVFRWYLQKLVFSIHFRPIGKPASLQHCTNLVSCFSSLCSSTFWTSWF